MPPQNPATFQAPKSSKAPLLATLFGLLFIAALAFGAWAYQAKQSAQNNVDKSVDTAVSQAKSQQQTTDQANFAQQLKQPYKSFASPSTYGSIKLSYPKNWSVYSDQSSSSEPINLYFYPDTVPSISGDTAYALRLELLTDSYSDQMNGYQTQIQEGSVRAKTYVPVKLASNKNVQRGTRLDGTINSGQNDSMILIPVRSQTLKVYTESTDYLDDFNKIVLPSLTFSP